MQRKMFPKNTRSSALLILGFASAAFLVPSARADFRDEVGYTQLRNEYGTGLPTGAGVRILQVEYLRDGYWAPQPTGELSGKSITYASSNYGGYSSHAYEVGTFLMGNNSSMTPGVSSFTACEAVPFTGRGYLNGTRSLAPVTATWDIENHSWGGNDVIWALQILQKEDYRIERDNVISVVGVDNGSSLSQMLANGYNSIAVGVSNGNHPRNGTTVDTTTRVKPDLVAPAAYTSYATPIVSSAATLLVGEINRTGSLSAARSPLVMKALLLAGATKAEFSNWSHTPQQPLDRTYGAGELNVYNSYKALVAGRQVSASNAEVKLTGWDSNTTSTSSRRLYFFTVPAGKKMALSAALAWYRHVSPDALWTTLTPRIENLDLKLWRSSSYTLGSLVSSSNSTIDNVEHVYETSLVAGQYALEVTASVNSEAFGLAWTSTLTDDGSYVQPPVVPVNPNPAPTGTVTNSGFEAVSVGTSGWNAYAYNPTNVSGWTFSAQSGLTANYSGFTISNPVTPDGSQVAFVQCQGSISTQVSLNAGTYEVSFAAANRANWGGQQTVIIYVNGSEVGRATAGTAYSTVRTNAFTVGAGTHTISFVGQATADSTMLIDQVTVNAAAVTVTVGSSGFENPDVGAFDFYAFRYTPATVAGSQDWTFSGSAGVTANGSGFTAANPVAPQGKQVAFLQTNNSVVSQTVAFTTAGNYQLSVSSAQRGNWNEQRQIIQVYLDGTFLGSISPSGAQYETAALSLSASAGNHVLTFRGISSGDSTAFIDNVTIRAN
jgi:hypothetical protein